MKAKTLEAWQSEKTIEDYEMRQYRDCLEVFLNDHHLQPCTITLVNGEKVSSIIIGCDRRRILIVRRKTAEPCIIRIAHIVSISAGDEPK